METLVQRSTFYAQFSFLQALKNVRDKMTDDENFSYEG